MILAINIGSTRFVIAIKKNDNNNIKEIFYLSKDFTTKSDFIKVFKELELELNKKKVVKDVKCKIGIIKGAIVSSVNPKVTDYLIGAIEEVFNVLPIVVDKNIYMDLDISRYNLKLLGSDRIVVCEAGLELYKSPIIVFDFGTATTVNVVYNNVFLGGSILPGLHIGIEALAKNTAQLKKYNISEKVNLIGRNTEECIISGAVMGNASMVDGMVCRIKKYLNEEVTVVVTGGSSYIIVPFCEVNIIHEPKLLIKGLFILYEKNIALNKKTTPFD